MLVFQTVTRLTAVLLSQISSPAPAPTASSVRIDSVWDFIIKGGPVMIPIGICSLVALTFIVERLFSLRRRNIIPSGFVAGVKTALAADPQQALNYCQSHPNPLSRILAAGIRRLGEPLERLEKHIRDAGEREIIHLRRYLRLLSVIASVAPLLGLLGTIFGMITAFQTVAASGEALGKTELLARGIYEAMITTAAGLCVAIPVLLCHHYFTARVEQLVLEMDAIAVEFIEDHGRPAWSRADSNGGVRLMATESNSVRGDSDGDGRAADSRTLIRAEAQ